MTTNWNSKNILPESEKLIEVHGHDWTEFWAHGKFIKYKPGSPKKLKGKSRFCMKDGLGNWSSEKETWKNVDEWRYFEAPNE